MLIALYLFVRSIFGGADVLEDRIEDAVTDPDRRRGAIEVVERIAVIEDALVEQTRVTSEALRNLHLRHDATQQDYLDVLRPLEEARREAARGLLAARSDLRGLLTRQEWAEAFPPPED